MTPQQFIAAIAPSAVAFMRAHKISAALITAQGALESGWGKTAQAMGNNLFGIKADSSWSGPTTTQQTEEYVQGQWETVTAKFRAYPSMQACLEDHDGFLLQPRYKNLIGADYATACRLIGAVDGYATDPNYGSQLLEIIKEYDLAKYDEEAMKVTYQSENVQLNGKPYKGVAVGDVTYPIWTLARDAGASLTKVGFGDVEIDGKKPQQVTQDGDTYVQWGSIPGITPHALQGGGFNFTTAQPEPATHDYSMVVTEADSAAAGTWAAVIIQTLDNGKPLGNQVITIAENGVQVCKDYTDATTGGYEYDITESTNKADTMVFSWTDPSGKTHAVTKTTQFTVPQTTQAPIPSDDSTVAVIPAQFVNDQVLLDAQTTDGKTLHMQLDTGAMTVTLTKADADTLGLSDPGGANDITIQGVTGSSKGYLATITLVLGGVSFAGIEAVVDPDFQGPSLLGYDTFAGQYDLLVSQKHNSVTVLK